MINNAKYKNNLLIISVYFTTLFLFWSICCNSILAQTVISGKLLGTDGKPMDLAFVEFLLPGDSTPLSTTEVDKDGNYKISTGNSGPLVIRFSGVNHSRKDVPLIRKDPNINIKLDVQLAYMQLPEKVGKINIYGNFNNYKSEEMKLAGDGTYQFTIETKLPLVKYRIYGAPLPKGKYVYDSQQGFLVEGEPKDGKLEVRVNTAPSSQFNSPVSVKFVDENSEVAMYANAILAIDDVSLQKSSARKEFLKTNRDGNSFTYDTRPLIKSIQEKIGKEADPILKQIYCFWQLDAARNYSPENKELLNSAKDQIIANVPANSVVAAYMYGYMIGIFDIYADEVSPSHRLYVDQFLQSENASLEARAYIIQAILSGAIYSCNEKVRSKYYALMIGKFPNSKAAKNVKERLFDKEIKISKGNLAPQFSLTSLDDPNVTFTIDSFKGKILLIDFWAVWCFYCKAELPGLTKAYEKFHSKGLEILSISYDRSPEDVAKYRKEFFKMPWLHTFVEGELKKELDKKFEISAIPKPVLIDGNTGKIIAITNELRGEQLDKTLEKFFK